VGRDKKIASLHDSESVKENESIENSEEREREGGGGGRECEREMGRSCRVQDELHGER